MNKLIDRAWFEQAWKDAGLKNQSAFGVAIGLTPPKVSLLLSGGRRVQMDEAQRIAAVLKQPSAAVLRALGQQYDDPWEYTKKIVGYVGAADRVVLYAEDAPDYGIEEVLVPFVGYDGVCLLVKGESMVPRYLPGEVIGASIFADDPVPLSRLIGRDVVARIRDGQTVLKTLQRGSQPGRFSLLSVNPHVPPILDADLEWASPVDFHLPYSGT